MSNSESVKYFAYGSNLWSEWIRTCNPSAEAESIALLKGYRLEFANPSFKWKGFAANIIPDPNSHVFGVLWDLKHNDLESLDAQERVSEGIYERIHITVEVNGEPIECLSYKVTETTRNLGISEYGENRKPSRVYKRVMLTGAKENKLPPEYINFLENIEDNGYDGEVDVKVPVHLLKEN